MAGGDQALGVFPFPGHVAGGLSDDASQSFPVPLSPSRRRNAAADAAFAAAQAYLSSREAQQMSESDLERELHRLGQDLMHKLIAGDTESNATVWREAADRGRGNRSSRCH